MFWCSVFSSVWDPFCPNLLVTSSPKVFFYFYWTRQFSIIAVLQLFIKTKFLLCMHLGSKIYWIELNWTLEHSLSKQLSRSLSKCSVSEFTFCLNHLANCSGSEYSNVQWYLIEQTSANRSDQLTDGLLRINYRIID